MAEAAHDDLEKPEALPRDIAMYIDLDVGTRMIEMSEGRDGVGAHRSEVAIVFFNQILWGCRTREDLKLGIECLVRGDPRWRTFYEQRAADERAKAQAFWDSIPDVEREQLRKKLRELAALHTQKAVH